MSQVSLSADQKKKLKTWARMIDEKTSNIKECEGGQGGYLRENFNRLSFLTQFLRVKIEEISALLAEVVMVSSLLARLKFELRSFLTIALRIFSAHNLWRHLARPRARPR